MLRRVRAWLAYAARFPVASGLEMEMEMQSSLENDSMSMGEVTY